MIELRKELLRRLHRQPVWRVRYEESQDITQEVSEAFPTGFARINTLFYESLQVPKRVVGDEEPRGLTALRCRRPCSAVATLRHGAVCGVR